MHKKGKLTKFDHVLLDLLKKEGVRHIAGAIKNIILLQILQFFGSRKLINLGLTKNLYLINNFNTKFKSNFNNHLCNNSIIAPNPVLPTTNTW